MDTMMPVMDGPSSLRILYRINPDLKVIVTSGLRDTQKHLDKLDSEVNGVLLKPYTANELLKKVAEILN